MKTYLAAALALLLVACTVADDREIWIEPAGPLVADSILAFTPRARHVATVEVFIDGRSQGRSPTNQQVRNILEGIDYGQTVRLEVVGVGPEPAPRAETTVVRDLLSLLEVTPAAGLHETGQSLVVEAAFSLALREDQLGPGAVRLTRPFASAPSAQVREVALIDPRRVRVTLDRPVDADGEISIELTVAARGGQPRPFQLGTWSVRDLRATVVARGFDPAIQPALASTFVDVEVTATGERPDLVELWSGSTRIAALDGPSPWSVRWDVTGQPEGTTPPIELRAPGRRVLRDRAWPEARIDHTAPRASACAGTWFGRLELLRQECIRVPIDEPVIGTPVLLANGLPVVYGPLGQTRFSGTVEVCPIPALPYGAASLDLGDLRDAAGNPLGGQVTCGPLAVPRWLSPLGFGPISAGGAELRAGAALALAWAVGAVPHPNAHGQLALLEQGTAPRLLTTQGPADALPAPSPWAPTMAGATVEEVSLMGCGVDAVAGWVERVAAGTSLHAANWTWGAEWTEAPLQAGADPREVAAFSDGTLSNPGSLAWTEATTAGGRIVRVRRLGGQGSSTDLGQSGDAATATVSGEPALWRGTGFEEASVAWVEADAGARVLRVARTGQPAWSDLGRPAESASMDSPALVRVTEAAFMEPTVAWSDGGHLRLSTRSLETGAWSPAITLDSGPGSAGTVADAPSFLNPGGVAPPAIAWIDRSPLGVFVRLATREQGAWATFPEAANAGVPGQVTSLVSATHTLTWTDEVGRIYVRQINW